MHRLSEPEEFLFGLCDQCEDPLRSGQQRHTRVREGDMPGVAHEQARAETILKFPDRTTDWRLRHVQ